MCLSIEVNRPDSILAKGTHAGIEWIVTHNDIGHRCGYARIPKGHPWHGKQYDEIEVDVHGGLTFAEADVPCDKGGADNAYWVGFDCAHYGDASDPTLPGRPLPDILGIHGVVRTQGYVEKECRALCDQIAAAAA